MHQSSKQLAYYVGHVTSSHMTNIYVTLSCCHLVVLRKFFQTSLYLNLIRSNKMSFLKSFHEAVALLPVRVCLVSVIISAVIGYLV